MTSNTNISETVSHSIINNTIFWKPVTRPFRYIYVNYFKGLRFLTEVSTKLQKMPFLGNLRTITRKGNMEIGQMTPFFPYTIINLFLIFISEFEYEKFIFMWSPLWFILVCKLFAESYRFRQLIALESRNPKIIKNLYYVLSTCQSQIPIFLSSSSWTNAIE